MKKMGAILLAVVAIAMGGCRNTDLSAATDGGAGETVPIHVIYRGTQCSAGQNASDAAWIDTASQFEQAWPKRHRSVLGGQSASPPQIDFGTHGVLMLHMGERPTAGYGLQLASPTGRIEKGALTIAVEWITPAPGTVVAQVITAPCILLTVPKGDYGAIRIVDPAGRTRATVTITPPDGAG